MKVLHVIPSFYPAYYYGGPIESVQRLCAHQAKNGTQVRVLTTDANGPYVVLDVDKKSEVVLAEQLKVRYCKRLIPHSVSENLVRLLPFYVRWADVVHLTAVYSFPTIPTLLICKVLGKPVVWSPRGALQQWEGSTRSTLKSVWELICRIVAPRHLVLHVTSDGEACESLQRFPGVESVIIPNGVTIPESVSHVEPNGVLRLLYLGRLHPKKGSENLLLACAALNKQFSMAWSLTIAGAGEMNYVQTLQDQIRTLGLSQHVRMVGYVRGEVKHNLFEHTDIVIVPSYTENFGMVVAEALAHGVPVIASKGTPWSRLEEMGCGLWVNNDPESLAKAIEQMGRMPLREMGNRGHEWMEREFSWDKRAREMLACYETLCDGFRSRQETP